jgi:hypothetical protein
MLREDALVVSEPQTKSFNPSLSMSMEQTVEMPVKLSSIECSVKQTVFCAHTGEANTIVSKTLSKFLLIAAGIIGLTASFDKFESIIPMQNCNQFITCKRSNRQSALWVGERRI